MSESKPRRTITNRYGLPSSMYHALANDPYVGGGDISITRLIAPPRIVALRKHFEDQIIEDASDRIWSLLGQSAHLVMERAADGNIDVVAETRITIPIEGITKPDGKPWVWTLSGQPDVYEKTILSDYKVTSVWSFMFGDKPEWDAQLNLQAMLHRHQGDEVNGVQIIAILRDWQRRKAQLEKDYPETAVHVVNFPLWEYEDQLAYAQRRVRLHQNAQKDFKLSGYKTDALPMCTEEERWYRGGAFLVKRKQSKSGKINKKSDRRAKSMEEAKNYIAQNVPPKGTEYLEVQEVPGEYIRCLNYCDVAMFCPFGRSLREKQEQADAARQPGESEEEEPSLL